jgi:hypothetical protein
VTFTARLPAARVVTTKRRERTRIMAGGVLARADLPRLNRGSSRGYKSAARGGGHFTK